MVRWYVGAGLVAWVGATLLLGQSRWVARRPLAERLHVHAPGGADTTGARGTVTVASFTDVLAPLARSVGSSLSRAFGVNDDLELRLQRAGSPHDVSSFRVNQLLRSLATLAAAGLVVGITPLPAAVKAFTLLGAPLLAFLLSEQEAANASRRHQDRLMAELPVVTEQIGMLLGAGYSLGASLQRVAERSSGACAADLTRVVTRVRHGLSEAAALREWAELAELDAVTRLVGVLALNKESGDLGHLIATEARNVRLELQRGRVEVIERRAQQVWIPVTVATLLPGVIFLAIPFIEAMRLFSTT